MVRSVLIAVIGGFLVGVAGAQLAFGGFAPGNYTCVDVVLMDGDRVYSITNNAACMGTGDVVPASKPFGLYDGTTWGLYDGSVLACYAC